MSFRLKEIIQCIQTMINIGLRHIGIGAGGIQIASVLSVLGVSTGLSTLIVVVAVMNGFQLEYIEDMA